MRNMIKTLIPIIALCASQSSFAALNLELTKGISAAIPIAVIPFTDNASSTDVGSIVQNDLANSGQFSVLNSGSINSFPHAAAQVDTSYWQGKNVDDVVVGSMQPAGNGQYKVTFNLVSVFSQPPNNILLSQSFTVNQNQLRTVAHHISDMVYQQLTGIPGVFSTKLTYVLVQRNPNQYPKYMLMVADEDGYNPQPILISTQPIMSPSWSPDGKQVAYVSFESYLPQIYISDVATGKRKLITSFKGINGAPEWSPDGRQLAVALSKDSANPNIYTLNLSGGNLQQVTNDWSINTEPNWSPDGKSLVFTSDRGGSPQVYQVNVGSKETQRLTFNGNYNASPSFTADSQNVVILNRQNGSFDIAILNLASGNTQVLTHGGNNQSPSVAPNGKMVVYATKQNGHSVLAMVSTDGKVNVQLPDQLGDVQEPAWSPFLN